jgi:toxin ParE1/3/4
VKVVIADAADAELEAISDWIAQEDQERALRFVRELLKRAYNIADFPSAYPVVESYQHRGVRRCVHGKYLIVYRVSGDVVEILHFVHGARDLSALLASDPL